MGHVSEILPQPINAFWTKQKSKAKGIDQSSTELKTEFTIQKSRNNFNLEEFQNEKKNYLTKFWLFLANWIKLAELQKILQGTKVIVLPCKTDSDVQNQAEDIEKNETGKSLSSLALNLHFSLLGTEVIKLLVKAGFGAWAEGEGFKKVEMGKSFFLRVMKFIFHY